MAERERERDFIHESRESFKYVKLKLVSMCSAFQCILYGNGNVSVLKLNVSFVLSFKE